MSVGKLMISWGHIGRILALLLCILSPGDAWSLTDSTTVLTSSVNPTYETQVTTLKATVTPATATGLVGFWNGTVFLASSPVNSGVATFDMSFPVAGTQNLTSRYLGDLTTAPSTSASVAQTVTARTASTAVLTSSINPTYEAQVTTLKATVTPATATGLVGFWNGTVFLASSPVNSGVATFDMSFPVAGTQNLTARYLGDLTTAPSANTSVAQTVTARTASTAVLTSSVNPTYETQVTTLKATLTPATATGLVGFWNGTVFLASSPVNSGVATFDMSFPVAGTQNLTSRYLGDLTNAPNTSAVLVQTIKAVVTTATTTALSASANPAYTGQAIALTATVTSTTATPTGVVTFKDGSAMLGSATLIGGLATLTANFSATGTHSLIAAYVGSASNTASTSSALGLVVNAPATLPAPPSAPAPVVNYEYDAQGNRTKTIQASGTTGFNFATQSSFDTLSRLKNATDARNGVTQFAYDGMGRTISITDPRNLVTQYPRNGLGDVTQLVSPDTGMSTQTNDAAGNLLTRTDSRGVLATYSYDALNRLIGIAYTQTGQTTLSTGWVYDQVGAGFSNGIGRLTSTTHPAGSTQYAYDPQGRLLTDTQRLNAATGGNAAQVSTTVIYAYDAAGNVTGITYPSGRVLSVTYTGGKPSAVALAKNNASTSTPLITQIQFSPFGGPQSWQWQLATGPQAYSRVFDISGRLVRYPLGGFIRDLAYDVADRITGYTHYDTVTATATAASNALNQGFGYDELGRLTGVTTAGASWNIGYDANGNRTTVSLNGSASTYATAPTSNRLVSISNPVRSFGYDSAGNTISDGAGYTSTYNLVGRMASLTKAGATNSYTYDAMGRRVRKFASTGPASTLIFVFDQGGHLLGEYDSVGSALREYVWLGDTPVAMFVPDAVTANPPLVYFIHADHLDTPRVVLDKNNAVRWRWLAEPFGITAPETNPQGLGLFTQNLRFPGQYADAESGLSYNFFRDYDSTTGRYTQSDPIGLQGGINTYAYVENNPLSYADPDGLQRIRPAPVFPGLQPRPVDPFDPGGPMYTPRPTRPDWLRPIAEMCKPTEQEKEERRCDEQYSRDLRYCASLASMRGLSRGRRAYNDTYSRCVDAAEEKYVQCYQDAKRN